MKRSSALKGDVLGGLVVALLSLPMTIPLGVLALSPLGADYVTMGVAAGFQASIISGIVSALTGGSRYQISGPRASISLIAAGAIATVLGHGATSDQALIMGYLVVFLSGCLQIAFGFARLGRAVKYIPYPVLAGFMNGVAILIILGQLAAALGLPSSLPWTELWSQRTSISWPALGVTLATMAAMRHAPRLTGKAPPIVVAFVLGVGLDHLLRLVLGAGAMGPLVGPLSAGMPSPGVIDAVLNLPWHDGVTGWLLAVAPTILVLALVGSVESLLSATAIDAITSDRHNANRELIGQGLGNCIGACFGGVASTGAPIRGITSFNVGGRTRRAAVVHSLALLALLLWGKTLLAALPYSVMAGIMIMIALSMNDSWAFVLARKRGRLFLADCLVVVLVVAISVLANLAVAVFSGVVLTLILFMLRMSRPVVRRVFDRTETKSLRERPLRVEKFLSQEGQRIVVMELDGPLFFGTTEQFRDEMERLAHRTISVFILDLRRVHYIDLSGVRMLRQTALAQKKLGRQMYLAGIKDHGLRREWLIAAGITAAIPLPHMFPLLDQALEAAEDWLASDEDCGNDDEIPLSGTDVLEGLTPNDFRHLLPLVERREYQAGEEIFRKGDKGDGFYLLVAGFIDINLPGREGEFPIRLATSAPGTMFGEMALLGGHSRSASAVALGPSVSYFLSNASFAKFQHECPAAAVKILLNIGAEMSERLRFANARFLAETSV